MRILIAFLLFCAPAWAVQVAIKSEIINGGNVAQQRGSGVVLQRDGDYIFVATAYHVCRSAQRCWIGGNSGWIQADSVHVPDPEIDFCVLKVRTDEELKPSVIAAADARPGDMIKWSGYSGGTTHEVMTGQVEGRVMNNITAADCRVRCKPGQSGGGVYNAKGEVIGIVHSYKASSGKFLFVPIEVCRRGCERRWGWFFGLGGGIAAPPRMPPPRSDSPPLPAEDESKPDDPAPPPPFERPAPQANDDYERLKAKIADLESELMRLRYTKIPVKILSEDGQVVDAAMVRLDKRIPPNDPQLKNSADLYIRLVPKGAANAKPD